MINKIKNKNLNKILEIYQQKDNNSLKQALPNSWNQCFFLEDNHNNLKIVKFYKPQYKILII